MILVMFSIEAISISRVFFEFFTLRNMLYGGCFASPYYGLDGGHAPNGDSNWMSLSSSRKNFEPSRIIQIHFLGESEEFY